MTTMNLHRLSLTFLLLTIVGWRPVNWSPRSTKSRLYTLFAVVVQTILHTYTILGLLDTFAGDNMDMFVDKFSLFLSVTGVSIKVINLFHRRNDIIELMSMLTNYNAVPRDIQEMQIQRKYDQHARVIAIWTALLNEATAFCAAISRLNRFLKIRTFGSDSTWSLYDLSSSVLFWTTAIPQSLGVILCASISVAHDCLICDLIICLTAQLEILCHRARTLPTALRVACRKDKSDKNGRSDQKRIVRDLIDHHLRIYEFSRKANGIFTLMILLQFSISSVVLCMSVYKMSTKHIFTMEFLWTVLYLGSMLTQIFLYCWVGNEITLKSVRVSDAIYEADWTLLEVNVMKDLLLVMVRSARPIKLTSGYVIVLSLRSFTSILKASYTSYNVLQSRQ